METTSILEKLLLGRMEFGRMQESLFVDDEAVCSQYVAYRGAIPIEDISKHWVTLMMYICGLDQICILFNTRLEKGSCTIKSLCSKALSTDRKLKKQTNGGHQRKWIRYLLEHVSWFKQEFLLYSAPAPLANV